MCLYYLPNNQSISLRLFFETLDFINRHARIDFTQEGHHDIFLQVGDKYISNNY